MADVRRFPYKGRRIATFEAIDGTTIITYEADQTQIDRIEREYGRDFIYGNAVYIAQYNKGSRNLSTVPDGPAGDQNILNGISNVDLVAEINNDSTFYNQATGTTPSQPTEQNPDQLGGSTPINPAPPGTPQQPEKAYLMYPLEMKSSQDRIMFQAYEYQSGNRLNPDNAELDPVKYVNPKQPILMAIQSSITDQNSVGWESDTLNPLEKFAASASRRLMGEEGAKTDIAAKVSEIFRSAAENLKVEKGAAGEAVRTYLVGQAIGVNNLQSRLLGQVLNPNLELLFQGPQLRPFNFSFKMSARNKNEAIEIKQIIKYFKKNMAAKKSETGIFLRAPNVFKIQYQFGTGTPHPGLNLIKMCALTNCSVDYTPLGSYTTYSDGTMVAYNMTLSFQELTPIYDGDYDKEFKYGEEAGSVPLTYYTENNGIGP